MPKLQPSTDLATKFGEDISTIFLLEKSLKDQQKESRKSLKGSLFEKPTEAEQIAVLREDFKRLSGFVTQYSETITKHQNSMAGLETSKDLRDMKSLGDCLKWSENSIECQGQGIDEGMNVPQLIKATDALYSGAIHLCNGLAKIMDAFSSGKDITGVVRKTMKLHSEVSRDVATNLKLPSFPVKDYDPKMVKDDSNSDIAAQGERRARVSKMKKAPSPSTEDRPSGIDELADVKLLQSFKAAAKLVGEIRIADVSGVENVAVGEVRTAITAKTHAAEVEKAAKKAAAVGGDGRAG
jgi:hypothetical protein